MAADFLTGLNAALKPKPCKQAINGQSITFPLRQVPADRAKGIEGEIQAAIAAETPQTSDIINLFLVRVLTAAIDADGGDMPEADATALAFAVDVDCALVEQCAKLCGLGLIYRQLMVSLSAATTETDTGPQAVTRPKKG